MYSSGVLMIWHRLRRDISHFRRYISFISLKEISVSYSRSKERNHLEQCRAINHRRQETKLEDLKEERRHERKVL